MKHLRRFASFLCRCAAAVALLCLVASLLARLAASRLSDRLLPE